jgi:heme-NO-binding protein
MKGVVLSEFVQFAEARWAVPPPSGAYNAVKTYEFEEMLGLVDGAAARAEGGRPEVLRSFGFHLFGRFATLYPIFFFDAESALDLLGGINSYVHDEVQKLYPDAQFPQFDVARESADRLTLVYRSARPLADLAEGLIRGCVAHFGRSVTVEREDLASDGRHTRFVLVAAPREPRG